MILQHHHLSLYSKENYPQTIIYFHTCDDTQLEHETEKAYILVYETDA